MSLRIAVDTIYKIEVAIGIPLMRQTVTAASKGYFTMYLHSGFKSRAGKLAFFLLAQALASVGHGPKGPAGGSCALGFQPHYGETWRSESSGYVPGIAETVLCLVKAAAKTFILPAARQSGIRQHTRPIIWCLFQSPNRSCVMVLPRLQPEARDFIDHEISHEGESLPIQ